MINSLIKKYNVPGPRYTSYPTVPYWKNSKLSQKEWTDELISSYQKNKKEGISLYIHLPFCESLCTFCGCHKHITKQHSVEQPYIETLIKEWKLYTNLLQDKPLIKEIHLGGGTPTFFSPAHLENLLNEIKNSSIINEDAELSFEGHPNNTTEEHLYTFYRLGFRRVSYGVQDYAEHVQKTINRIQPFKNVKKVHDLAKRIGYTSISHDLVYGLPKQSLKDVLNTIDLTNRLRPDRISLYSYAHVPWIKGVGQRGYDENDLPKDEEKRVLYEKAKAQLLNNGYFEVGMDHFALETDELYISFKENSLHRNFMGYTTNNTKVMIGLGMSSISDSWNSFSQNVKTVKEYTELVNNDIIPVFKGHILSDDDLEIRKHILNLMCEFKTTIYDDFKTKSFYNDIIERLNPLQEDKLVIINDNEIIVTETGKIFIRNICMCFDILLHQNKPDTKVFSSTI